MTKFVEDSDGHLWPVTGDYCRVCGWPLIKAALTQTAHPNCQAEQEKTQ